MSEILFYNHPLLLVFSFDIEHYFSVHVVILLLDIKFCENYFVQSSLLTANIMLAYSHHYINMCQINERENEWMNPDNLGLKN